MEIINLMHTTLVFKYFIEDPKNFHIKFHVLCLLDIVSKNNSSPCRTFLNLNSPSEI